MHKKEMAMRAAPLKVSVVLVTYNRAPLLNETIKSILNQSFSDFELIIADDASNDNTEQICTEWTRRDQRIQYHRRDTNVGMPNNLTLGIDASKGAFVAVVHDDDVYSPTLLDKWSYCLAKYPQAAFVFNAYNDLDINGKVSRTYCEDLLECENGAAILERLFFHRWRFDSPVFGTVMIRKSALDRVGVFDKRFGFYSDVDMWMRLAENYDVCYIKEALIGITSRELSPHQFDDNRRRIQPMIEQMFWEARMRHYRGRPILIIAETLRHLAFMLASRVFNLLLSAKHALNPNRYHT
jgi:glycosyltransferase involved in cell wall biosynthesis